VELRQLRYFLKIVDAGSFSKASQVLHIAQPALSQQIMQLEGELGHALLRRKHSGVEVTECGRTFYRHAQRILKDIEDLPNVVQEAGSELVGSIAVGLPQSTALHYAMPLLEAVAQRHPGVRLELFDEISGNLLRGLESGRMDVAVIVSDQDAALLDSVPLMEEELFFVAGTTMKLPAVVHVGDLGGYRMALPGRHHGVRSLVEEAVRSAGAVLPLPAVEANSVSIMLRSLETGAACSIMPWGAIDRLLANGSVHAVPLSPCLSRKVYVSSTRGESLSLAAVAVKRLLTEIVSSQVRSGLWQGVRLL